MTKKLSVGVKYDTGKPRYDLMPPLAEDEIMKVLTVGAQKYSEDNWRIVDEKEKRYMAAAMRHINAYRRGELWDPDDGLHHLAHAATCLVFLSELDLEQKTEPEKHPVKVAEEYLKQLEKTHPVTPDLTRPDVVPWQPYRDFIGQEYNGGYVTISDHTSTFIPTTKISTTNDI